MHLGLLECLFLCLLSSYTLLLGEFGLSSTDFCYVICFIYSLSIIYLLYLFFFRLSTFLLCHRICLEVFWWFWLFLVGSMRWYMWHISRNVCAVFLALLPIGWDWALDRTRKFRTLAAHISWKICGRKWPQSPPRTQLFEKSSIVLIHCHCHSFIVTDCGLHDVQTNRYLI